MNESNEFIDNMLNKYVSFGTQSDTLGMKVEQVITISGHTFIKGVVPKGATESDNGEGMTCAVALSAICDFMVFPDEKSYLKFMNKL